MPDAPQRIATDTSQKLPIRFGETIKAYQAKGLNMDDLVLLPLVLAGYARYIRGIPSDVLVRHFGRNQVIPQQASVNGHGRVKGVQAGADLHPLHLVHGLPVHVHHAAQLQGRTRC